MQERENVRASLSVQRPIAAAASCAWLSTFACIDDGARSGDEPTTWRDGSVEDVGEDVEDSSDLELAHESIRHVAPDGSSVLVSSTGDVSAEVEQATARPWTHMHEPYIYNDESWMVPLENGDVEVGFRIWRRPNDEPYVPEPTSGLLAMTSLPHACSGFG